MESRRAGWTKQPVMGVVVLWAGVLPAFGDLTQRSVSSNDRYLQDASGHPFFLVGDGPQQFTTPGANIAGCEDGVLVLETAPDSK